MSRPKCCRRIGNSPEITYFRPDGVRALPLLENIISLDELEAVRLADMEGLYQDEAARIMNVSRQTFGRIIVSARGKIADALISGKALRIEGGSVEINPAVNRCEICSRRVEGEICLKEPGCTRCRKTQNK